MGWQRIGVDFLPKGSGVMALIVQIPLKDHRGVGLVIGLSECRLCKCGSKGMDA